MLLAVKSFGIFPKHNGYAFASDFFALSSYIFIIFDLEKLIEYSASVTTVVLSNLVLVLYQELRSLYFYYQYAQIFSYQLHKK